LRTPDLFLGLKKFQEQVLTNRSNHINDYAMQSRAFG